MRPTVDGECVLLGGEVMTWNEARMLADALRTAAETARRAEGSRLWQATLDAQAARLGLDSDGVAPDGMRYRIGLSGWVRDRWAVGARVRIEGGRVAHVAGPDGCCERCGRSLPVLYSSAASPDLSACRRR